jgi:hypothetical protein
MASACGSLKLFTRQSRTVMNSEFFMGYPLRERPLVRLMTLRRRTRHSIRIAERLITQ